MAKKKTKRGLIYDHMAIDVRLAKYIRLKAVKEDKGYIEASSDIFEFLNEEDRKKRKNRKDGLTFESIF